MDLYWRRKCGACRLKKCQLVGMRPEYVSNREAKKREKPRGKTTEVKKPLPKKQLSGFESKNFNSLWIMPKSDLKSPKVIRRTTEWGFADCGTGNGGIPRYNTFFKPFIDSYSLMRGNKCKNTRKVGIYRRHRYKTCSESCCILQETSRLHIKWKPKINKSKGFDSLPQADQVALIKASTVDASFLRSAFSFAMNPEVSFYLVIFAINHFRNKWNKRTK